MKRQLRSAAKILAMLLAFAGCNRAAPASAPVVSAAKPPSRVGTMPSFISEASGLAASRRADNLLWAHNDSGGEPLLYALDAKGALRGKLRIGGEKNTDWEDIAAFDLDGHTWLLVADTGDNDNKRNDGALLIVAEPDPADLRPDRELMATVAWRVPVRYPDGPRDCESVAVDAREGKIYL